MGACSVRTLYSKWIQFDIICYGAYMKRLDIHCPKSNQLHDFVWKGNPSFLQDQGL